MHAHRVLRFVSPAVPADSLLPHTVQGREALNQPFSYTIDLVAKTSAPEVDPAAILAQPATLELLQGSGSRQGPTTWLPIRGILAEFAETGHGHDWIRYRARLVPPLWQLSLTRRTRVHQQRSVPAVVDGLLAAAGLPAIAWDLRGRYPEREYILQYQEDDLAFFSRLLEAEGIAWYHRHDPGDTVLVATDHSDGWALVAGDPTIPFRPRHRADGGGEEPAAAQDWFQQEVVDDLARRQQRVPQTVAVRAWNDRTPGHDLTASATIDPDGAGLAVAADDHLADGDASRRLARLRAEEWRCRQTVFTGGGDQRGFRCGHRFTLESHPRQAFAQDYLLTEVRHEITQALDGGSGAGASTHYANEFRAQPVTQPYRPPLVTPRPVVSGVLQARVEAPGGGGYAELDAQGRYRVRLMAVPAEAAAGANSLPVPMAQPHSGERHGFHLPLHDQAEVLLAHVAGDPDRPYIAGTVPNPDTPSVVAAANHTQSIWRSAGQHEVRFEDLQGQEELYLHAPRDLRIVVWHDATTVIGGEQATTVAGSQTVTISANRRETVAKLAELSVGGALNETIGGARIEEVGAAKHESVAGERTLTVGKDLTLRVSGAHHAQASGAQSLSAKTIQLTAEDELLITVGAASIRLRKDGDIRIAGRNLSLVASGKLTGKAAGEARITGSSTAAN